MNALLKIAALLAFLLPALLLSKPSGATVFAAWEVSGVPWGDVLNVRKYPSPSSQKQGAYPNGTVLQMTGKCTGGVNLLDIAGRSTAVQKQLVRRQWCQVWHDPAQNGSFTTGWVYGRFIMPVR